MKNEPLVRPQPNVNDDVEKSERQLHTTNGAEGFERVPVKLATQPKMPSKEEVIQHNYTHSPYRSWCPYCAAGKRDDVAHGKVKEPREIPVVKLMRRLKKHMPRPRPKAKVQGNRDSTMHLVLIFSSVMDPAAVVQQVRSLVLIPYFLTTLPRQSCHNN